MAVPTEKGKDFVNARFRMPLNYDGFKVGFCRNPGVKYAVVERF